MQNLFANGQFRSVDVTALVSGNGLVSFVLDTSSSTVMALRSRELAGLGQPVLEIETTGSTPPPPPPAPATFAPVADAYVDAGFPSGNNGTSTKLRRRLAAHPRLPSLRRAGPERAGDEGDAQAHQQAPATAVATASTAVSPTALGTSRRSRTRTLLASISP